MEGNKNFQPREDDHEQLVLRISCAPRGSQTLVFVSAVQDRYALKKSPTSASVGVGALGSVSLPFGSNDDSLVKVASSTVTDAEFYRRFFQRLQQYLPAAAGTPSPSPSPAAAPNPHRRSRTRAECARQVADCSPAGARVVVAAPSRTVRRACCSGWGGASKKCPHRAAGARWSRMYACLAG